MEQKMDFYFIENPNSSKVLFFLHGWACEPKDFKEQVKYFQTKYSVLTVDYTQLIISSSQRNIKIKDAFQYCFSEIIKVINKLRLTKVCFIGHSLGGALALSLSDSLREITSALIIIDTSLFAPYNQSNFRLLKTPILGEKFIKDYIKGMNSKLYDNALVNEQKLSSMIHNFKLAPNLFTNLLEEAVKLDKSNILHKLDLQFMYIARQETNLDFFRLQNLLSSIKITKVKSGHFIMLHAPNQLNSIIESFLLESS